MRPGSAFYSQNDGSVEQELAVALDVIRTASRLTQFLLSPEKVLKDRARPALHGHWRKHSRNDLISRGVSPLLELLNFQEACFTGQLYLLGNFTFYLFFEIKPKCDLPRTHF